MTATLAYAALIFVASGITGAVFAVWLKRLIHRLEAAEYEDQQRSEPKRPDVDQYNHNGVYKQ